MRVVLLTPLFFGAAHLHHAAELVRHQGATLRRAAATVCFQMAYTTIFGWFATYLFLRTGHLAAPVAAHIFCNWAGFPPFADMAAHTRGLLLLLTTAAGAAAFWMCLPRMTAPQRYEQSFYGGW
ncbi:CAAX prenyl protease 2 [Tetrabaena socialis]|uniref:intramembrane prenyl-peptidase Rce1 n=1 Tax=Tetrabaena socialis TaxID=47790 RepID=A0A2J8A959_9CHLO|nr:CAAX prenyl protease 2 [Tetrabaena socialis]|eukprot:PNH09067.1 CAAX prenyl protease 2 [Tetrabaena socialis]